MRVRSALPVLLSVVLASCLWLITVHHVYSPGSSLEPDPSGVPPRAQELAKRHLALWSDERLRANEQVRMRASNAEWDFMGRSFLAWSFANLALRQPAEAPRYLKAIDAIIDETLKLEAERGMHHFLMPYSRRAPFVMQPERSQFLDGEIALMLAHRLLIAPREDYRSELVRRVEAMTARMEQSPVLSAESYPDECWTFCNTVALAAIRGSDAVTGSDHSELARRWVEVAREKLVEPETGLLIASYTVRGEHLDKAEGSSIWLSASMLQLVDEPFAREQYKLARKQLGHDLLGFGWAREWPAGAKEQVDVDSGPIVPWLEVSAGSSGLAFVGAASFGDSAWNRELHTTLNFAGFPTRDESGLRFAASNQVGDAVVLYALSLGPAFDAFRARLRERSGV